MIKKPFIIMILLIILLISITACATTSKANNTIVLGLLPSVDSIPFVIADKNGFFEKHKVNVQLVMFKSAKDRDAAFQSGALNGALSDQVAVCLYQNGGFDVKITGITDGDFTLIAGKNSGIKKLNDLKSKKIAISENTVIEYILDRVLEQNSIQTSEIEKIAIPPIPVRLEMLNNNQIDAALLPEPFSSFALNSNGTPLISANNQGMFPAVSVFTQNIIDKESTLITNFYKAYNETVTYINTTPISEYEDIVINTIGYPEDMKGHIKLPIYRLNTLPSDKELNDVLSWARNKGLITKDLAPKDLKTNKVF